MSQEPHPQPQTDPLEDASDCTLAGEYSALCRSSSEPPDVFTFLNSRPHVSQDQRRRLVLWDQARSCSGGEARGVEDYLRACPELADDSELLLKLVVREYFLREHRPSVQELVDRFPNLRAQLLQQLCGHEEHSAPGASSASVAAPALREETATSSFSSLSAVSETDRERSGGATACATVRRPGLLPDSERAEPGETAGQGPRRLHNSFPFQSLPAALVDELESHMVEQTFAAGQFLIRQGEPGKSLLLLREGTVDVFTDDQGERYEIDRSVPGDILGEMALLTDEPCSASVVACEPVKVLLLPADKFHEYAVRNPEISRVLTQLLAQRLGGQKRDVLVGKTLDRYRIVRRLGRGGMSVVYEGVDQQSGRRVALKMLSHRLVYDTTSLTWFQREADIIESFSHDNIVRMFGRFRAFHSYFIVMEFCDGVTFERLVRLNGPMRPDDFRKAFGQLASAVLYAHRRGVIHRDIKPVNLMLNVDGLLKLMDFGLATPLHAVSATQGRDMPVVGTPRYMAPEQLKGRELTEATDYFSLGCTAYKLLTGEPLFAEPDVGKLRELHSRWKVPDFATLRPELAPEFCELLTGCLHRRPENRLCDLTKYAEWAAPLDVARWL